MVFEGQPFKFVIGEEIFSEIRGEIYLMGVWIKLIVLFSAMFLMVSNM